MCQCICCDCWWINYCGICCAGLHDAYCCISCWLCKPEQLERFDADCCHICTWTGIGGNFFCSGSVCCAPQPLLNYSMFMSGQYIGKNATQESPASNQVMN